MKLLLRWLINSLILILIAYFVSGIEVSSIYIALITALFLGLVNALIRPLLILITLPINILTLGLFTLVINALLFWFVATFVQGFEVASFVSAFIGAFLLAIGSWVTNRFIVSAKNSQR